MKSSWLSLAVVVILSIYCINAAPTRTISTQATEAAGESANEFPFLDNNGDDEDGSSSTCTTTAPPIVSLADIKSSLLQTKSIILEAIRDHAESVDDGDEDLLVKRLEEAVTSFDVEEAQDQIQIEQMQTALNDIITCSICLDKFTKDTTVI